MARGAVRLAHGNRNSGAQTPSDRAARSNSTKVPDLWTTLSIEPSRDKLELYAISVVFRFRNLLAFLSLWDREAQQDDFNQPG